MMLFQAAWAELVYAAAESNNAAHAIPDIYGSDNVTFAVEPVNALANWPVSVLPSMFLVTLFEFQTRLTLTSATWRSLKTISRSLAYGLYATTHRHRYRPFTIQYYTMTLKVMVRGVGSRSTPSLSVPPSSWTWKVKVVYGAPNSPRAGV